jgi:hypothetical protein
MTDVDDVETFITYLDLVGQPFAGKPQDTVAAAVEAAREAFAPYAGAKGVVMKRRGLARARPSLSRVSLGKLTEVPVWAR